MKALIFLCLTTSLSALNHRDLNSAQISLLAEKLRTTEALNIDQIIEEVNLPGVPFRSRARIRATRTPVTFQMKNPYFPRFADPSGDYLQRIQDQTDGQDSTNDQLLRYMTRNGKFFNPQVIIEWYAGLAENTEVCAVKFTNNTQYELKTFTSKESALEAGYIVTHKYRCGACSTLQDLAVYLDTPNLTEPARRCAKKTRLRTQKNCYKRQIGFTSLCSEAWAYNSSHTKYRCITTCVQDYGLVNIILNRFDQNNNGADGEMAPCIACDEYKSGPGFKYTAGRTRRNSGIISAINRDQSEISMDINHLEYFPGFDLTVDSMKESDIVQ